MLTYTAQGWLAEVTTPGGRTTRTDYDAEGRPVRVTDPRGAATESTYDAYGRLESVTVGAAPVGDQPALNLTTTYEYDVNSRVVGGVQQIKANIDFHTYSELVLWPFGYTYSNTTTGMTADQYNTFATLGRQMANTNGYTPEQASDLYITDGSSIDWMWGVHRIWAYTFEMYPGSAWGGGFYPPDEVIGRETARNKDAVLVTNGEEVLEVAAPVGLFTLTEARAPEHPRDRLSTTERQVLDAVPVVQAVPARKIAKTAGVSISGTHEALLVLLRTGLVEHALGRWRLVREESA